LIVGSSALPGSLIGGMFTAVPSVAAGLADIR
jgi:hypothetical protein